tara:strand:- start:112 stop:633 length:522 start_codon:yes stop_codon:yes gene_type:complete
MGFDISGVNPKMHKTDYPLLDKYSWDNYECYDTRQKDMEKNGEKEAYWDQWEQRQEDNPGIYFRNSVWFWRPLWEFVCTHCDDILTREDIKSGCFNDHHEISADKAVKISVKLNTLLLDKTVDQYSSAYEEYRKNIAESDDKEQSFMGNYPFNKENIIKFAKFCEESGGFIIS